MSQRGFSGLVLVVLVFVLFIGVISISLGLKFFNLTTIYPQSVHTENSQKDEPEYKVQSTKLYLSDAWQKGVELYSNSRIDLTFEYPKGMEVHTEMDLNKPFIVRINTPDIPIEERNKRGFDWKEYDENAMYVLIYQLSNKENLPLYDFLAKRYESYPGAGKTETFETYKKYLKTTNLPKAGSYEFTGNISENPIKEVYFEDKQNVYLFQLGGGHNTGDKYSDNANRIFENMLMSIKFID